mmetsp:Transcript_27728/g.51227  ORF Transcript_27728/g.51227 Transcript_27728/m.51227 type:complete len:211 (+) Transcript_27728:669-1301(+)
MLVNLTTSTTVHRCVALVFVRVRKILAGLEHTPAGVEEANRVLRRRGVTKRWQGRRSLGVLFELPCSGLLLGNLREDLGEDGVKPFCIVSVASEPHTTLGKVKDILLLLGNDYTILKLTRCIWNTTAHIGLAMLIVPSPLVLITKDFVSILDVLELFLSLLEAMRIFVRVPNQCLFAISFLNNIIIGILGSSKKLVKTDTLFGHLCITRG